MDDVLHELLTLEEQLAAGPGEPYRRLLTDDAVVIVPGAVLDREQCAAIMDTQPGWDEHAIANARVSPIGADAAALVYRWSSRRGDVRYRAAMTSVYVRRDGGWRLSLHQQTPDPD